MNKGSGALFFLVYICLWQTKPATAASSAHDWELINDEQGIQAYRREVSNSDVLAFRGESTIDASPAKITQILSDMTIRKQWIANLIENREVKVMSPFERIEYTQLGTPWPLKNRDFIFHAQVELHDADKIFKILFHSVEDASIPESSCVRGWVQEGHYILKSLEGGKKTWVQIEMMVDPKGAIPTWIVNIFQKKWPLNTLKGIRAMSRRTDIADHPMTLKWLQKIEASQSK